MITKTCTKCGETKPIDQFAKATSGAHGVRSGCKECVKSYNRDYREANRDKAKDDCAKWRAENKEYAKEAYAKWSAENPDYHREWRAKNPESVKAAGERFRAANIERVKEWAVAWRRNNPDKVKAQQQRYRAKHSEKIALGVAKWRALNQDKVKRTAIKAQAKVRATAKGRLEQAVSANLRNGIRRGSKQGRRTFALLGYTCAELMAHLEKLFTPGMTWDNYGHDGWSIDHVIPRSVFNYNTPDDIDFKRCWALSNLQPLWEKENSAKRDRLDQPFQPSLALAA